MRARRRGAGDRECNDSCNTTPSASEGCTHAASWTSCWALGAAMPRLGPIFAVAAAIFAAAVLFCPWGKWAAALGATELPHGARTSVHQELLRGVHISRRDNATLVDFLDSIVSENRPFAGQTVIVTGASRGLGRGIAIVLLAAGVNLGLPLRTFSDGLADELLAESESLRRDVLGKATPPPGQAAPTVKLWQMDLADLSSVQSCVSAMRSANFRADAVINNAGLTSPYDEVTAQGYELTAGVNFVGTAHFTLSLLKAGVIGAGSAAGHAARVVMVSSEEHRADNIEPLQTRYSTPESFCMPDAEADGGMHNAMRRYATSKLLLTTFSHELARQRQVRPAQHLPLSLSVSLIDLR